MRLIFHAIIIVLAASLSSCAGKGHDVAVEDSTEISDLTAEIDVYCKKWIQTLDTAQKAAQLVMPTVYASSDQITVELVKDYARMGVGGIIFLKGDIESAKALVDTFRLYSIVEPFIGIDAEWGLGMRLHDAPKFPANGDINERVPEQLLFDYGREVADESRKIGINMILGPVLDISSPRSYIGRRSYGTDPKRVTDYAIAYARGVESGNVMSVAKHFPGHGAAVGDSHKSLPSINRSLQSIDSIDLQPFKSYIANGLSGVMVGHLAFPAIDPKGLPAALSKTVITDLLRTDLNFKGIVFTDALNMLGAKGMGADKAILAGTDIVLAPTNTEAEINNIINAMRSGELSMKQIDRHLERILSKKYTVCLSEPEQRGDSITSPDTERIKSQLKGV